MIFQDCVTLFNHSQSHYTLVASVLHRMFWLYSQPSRAEPSSETALLLLTADWLPPKSQSQSQSHIMTDGQSVSQSACLDVEPLLVLMTRYLSQLTGTLVSLWSTLSEERSHGYPRLQLQLSYDRQSVGQSVLVSGVHLGLLINFSFSLKCPLDSCGFVIL
jgi:hypothetical protein